MSKGLLKYFKFSEPSSFPATGSIPAGALPYPGGTTSLTVGQEIVLSDVKLKKIHYDDKVFLTASVGWLTLEGPGVQMQFAIRRGGVTGTIVATYKDEGAATSSSYTTTINHAEGDARGKIDYVLTATLLSGTAQIEGPISFEGFVIDEN